MKKKYGEKLLWNSINFSFADAKYTLKEKFFIFYSIVSVSNRRKFNMFQPKTKKKFILFPCINFSSLISMDSIMKLCLSPKKKLKFIFFFREKFLFLKTAINVIAWSKKKYENKSFISANKKRKNERMRKKKNVSSLKNYTKK